MVSRAFIGTSGWMYDAWKGWWYEGVRKKDWLRYDADRFTAVEVDGTFYRQQKRETFENWASQVPDDFRFAIRGHRYVTHNKKLLNATESVLRVKEPAQGLGHKLACVLWQLPPKMRVNVERLEAFALDLAQWPETRHVMEFRHESWFTEEVAEVLSRYGLANCISDSGSFPRWDAVTTDLVYVRLHGRPWTYASRYEDPELDWWAEQCRRWLAENREVHVYFDNDAHGHAPWDAMRLLDRVGVPASAAFLA
jgi:uncharacterized protein YecE (DUF72 family)